MHLQDSGSTQFSAAIIRDNDFDADPYHLAASRGSGGTWTSAGAPCAGVRALNLKGVVVEYNRFQNVNYPVYTNNDADNPQRGDIAYCDPASVGFSVSNRGIGVVPFGGVGYLHVIRDSNPTSATYKQQSNPPSAWASAMPTTGEYVTGHFVQNITPSGGTYGWARCTTGTAHVAGTDWKAVAAT